MNEEKIEGRRLAAYRQRLREAGFKRISAYVSLDLLDFLRSRRAQGECVGRTLERLLLGSAKNRPPYYSDEEIAKKESRRLEWAATRAQTRKPTRAEQRVLRRAEWERLKTEVMEELDQANEPEFSHQ